MRKTFAIITVPLLLFFAFYLLAMTGTEDEDATAAGRNRQVRSDPVVQEQGKPRETLEQTFVRVLAEERAAALPQEPATPAAANPPLESPGNSAGKTTPGPSLPRETPSDSTQKEPVWGLYVGIAQSPDDLIDLEATQLIGRLVITGDRFSNQSLNHLDGRRILSLSIESVNIGNSGLLHVSKVKNLCELRLWAPGVNDHGLEILAEMHHLEVLDLEGTSVQGTGLTHLSNLEKLRKLTLGPRNTRRRRCCAEDVTVPRRAGSALVPSSDRRLCRVPCWSSTLADDLASRSDQHSQRDNDSGNVTRLRRAFLRQPWAITNLPLDAILA